MTYAELQSLELLARNILSPKQDGPPVFGSYRWWKDNARDTARGVIDLVARIYVLESELALERGRVQGMRDAAAIIHKNPSYLDEMIALLEAKPAAEPTVEFTAEMVAALMERE